MTRTSRPGHCGCHRQSSDFGSIVRNSSECTQVLRCELLSFYQAKLQSPPMSRSSSKCSLTHLDKLHIGKLVLDHAAVTTTLWLAQSQKTLNPEICNPTLILLGSNAPSPMQLQAYIAFVPGARKQAGLQVIRWVFWFRGWKSRLSQNYPHAILKGLPMLSL